MIPVPKTNDFFISMTLMRKITLFYSNVDSFLTLACASHNESKLDRQDFLLAACTIISNKNLKQSKNLEFD